MRCGASSKKHDAENREVVAPALEMTFDAFDDNDVQKITPGTVGPVTTDEEEEPTKRLSSQDLRLTTVDSDVLGAQATQEGPVGTEPQTRLRGKCRSVVAFDVDRTVLHQGTVDELERFRAGVCQTLINLAEFGYKLAAVTGNSIAQLSKRFMAALLEELSVKPGRLRLLSQFHFFCNGAAVYVHVDPERSSSIASLLRVADRLTAEKRLQEAFNCLFDAAGIVRSAFVVTRYVQQCCIDDEDCAEILDVCTSEARLWWDSICNGHTVSELAASQFYIANGDSEHDSELKELAARDHVNKEASVFGPIKPGAYPEASTRVCRASNEKDFVTSLNILPILSFRHARNQILLAADDPRMQMIRRIKSRLRCVGLVHYIVNPGGRGTIDISHHLVNKKSAIVWLLRRLGAEGVEQMGEPMGANCVYFGDEVVLNGNDMAVADVKGILVFAVNELTQRVPFRTNVELPTQFTKETGPEATQAVLESLLEFTRRRMSLPGPQINSGASFVRAWKESLLKDRLQEKCGKLLSELVSETAPSGQKSQTKVTYRRLEAAAAAMTALTRRGEGFDDFAEQIVESVNGLGMVCAKVKEQQYETMVAQGASNDYREDSGGSESQDEAEAPGADLRGVGRAGKMRRMGNKRKIASVEGRKAMKRRLDGGKSPTCVMP